MLQEADRCVKCGLCLAVCPTYQVLVNEADSPRGRISLLQGLWSGALKADERLEAHLQGCLQCLRCQAACPSGVDYQRLIEAGLAELPKRSGWLLWLLTRASTWRWVPGLFNRWRSGVFFKAGRKLLPKPWRSLLEAMPGPVKPLTVGPAQTSGPALFLGCVSRLVDNGAQRAFVRLCDVLGFSVQIPQGQGCCGALHAHSGRSGQAKRLAANNSKAFADASAIISLASGCSRHLQRTHGEQVQDACHWLSRQSWPESLQLQPLNQRVALHSPCSQKPEERQAMLTLLRRIPELEFVELGKGFGCCGGAGMALVEQPLLGQKLVSPLLDEIRTSGASLLLTSNTGCALQLRRTLSEAGLALEVLHPLELLARQLC